MLSSFNKERIETVDVFFHRPLEKKFKKKNLSLLGQKGHSVKSAN